jgi:tight adherence protein C
VWSREAAAAPVFGGRIGSLAADQEAEAGLAGWRGILDSLATRARVSGEEQLRLRQELVAAGIRDRHAVRTFIGARLFAAAVTPVLTLLLIHTFNDQPAAVWAPVFLAGYLGYRLPQIWLKRRIQRRQEAIHRGLPDFLDLLVISVDSGLSLDNAISDTARDLVLVHPVISEELGVFLAELRAGATRADALRNLARRTGEPEMRKLTSLLIQADRFGASIQRVLRTQARYLRLRRRHRAEELAHKVGVKMIFPIFFLIMPTIFLVTAGPAVLQLVTKFRGLASGL